MSLGNALGKLGERESGTARFEQSVAAYRAALEERTRERAPLDWAATQVALEPMANRKHLKRLREGVDGWNAWRAVQPSSIVANFSRANLSGANLNGADLRQVELQEAQLSWASLKRADLSEADLTHADLFEANLSRADLSGAILSGVNLSGAKLSKAHLSEAYLSGADLSGADLRGRTSPEPTSQGLILGERTFATRTSGGQTLSGPRWLRPI
jgi:uncharacterized protein YjbI with pentapeptide repeats